MFCCGMCSFGMLWKKWKKGLFLLVLGLFCMIIGVLILCRLVIVMLMMVGFCVCMMVW